MQNNVSLLDTLKRLENIVTELYPGHIEPEPESVEEYKAVWDAVMNAREVIAQASSTAAASVWYTKKPVTIEAMVYEGTNGDQIKKFTQGGCYLDLNNPDQPKFMIQTLEGEHIASVGDYIIKGVKGEFYPCKPDIFAMTYEPVAAPVAQGVEPELPWDMPTQDRFVYSLIAKKDPEDRGAVEGMVKKYVDLCAQAIIDRDAALARIAELEGRPSEDGPSKDDLMRFINHLCGGSVQGLLAFSKWCNRRKKESDE